MTMEERKTLLSYDDCGEREDIPTCEVEPINKHSATYSDKKLLYNCMFFSEYGEMNARNHHNYNEEQNI